MLKKSIFNLRKILLICVHLVAVMALIAFLVALMDHHQTEEILADVLMNEFESLHADQNEVKEYLSNINYDEFTMSELELISVYMADIHDELISFNKYDDLLGCTKANKKLKFELISMCSGLNRFVSHLMPSDAENISQDRLLNITAKDISKLELIKEIHRIMIDTSDGFLKEDFRKSNTVESYFIELHGNICNFLGEQYNYNPQPLSLSNTILKDIFD